MGIVVEAAGPGGRGGRRGSGGRLRSRGGSSVGLGRGWYGVGLRSRGGPAVGLRSRRRSVRLRGRGLRSRSRRRRTHRQLLSGVHRRAAHPVLGLEGGHRRAVLAADGEKGFTFLHRVRLPGGHRRGGHVGVALRLGVRHHGGSVTGGRVHGVRAVGRGGRGGGRGRRRGVPGGQRGVGTDGGDVVGNGDVVHRPGQEDATGGRHAVAAHPPLDQADLGGDAVVDHGVRRLGIQLAEEEVSGAGARLAALEIHLRAGGIVVAQVLPDDAVVHVELVTGQGRFVLKFVARAAQHAGHLHGVDDVLAVRRGRQDEGAVLAGFDARGQFGVQARVTAVNVALRQVTLHRLALGAGLEHEPHAARQREVVGVITDARLLGHGLFVLHAVAASPVKKDEELLGLQVTETQDKGGQEEEFTHGI